MLASMDITGIIHVRNIKDLSDAETILYTLNSIPKEIDDFSRVLFNSERPGCETELLVIIQDQLLALDMQGRQMDSTSISGEHVMLSVNNMAAMDNRFIYMMIVRELTSFMERCQ